ncbi:hypothetical protein GCM10011344_25700 [Dokdonia pacifica]|uniref:Tetratricopeptide repeat-containing protein n=1 Tax=Dokdonia pacifica TaxID=1627892 RepID=A0A238WS42_9FLAO|nr:tetratricopeptide repeat protein [Dokdonia pacifica]GGG23779.1 hypothetical protein GCM10011344_25700 [Dokdonia pacifica]SNR49400.1 Tetratricopeptide repeat-containing protein [Dokdonia pacifica]
MIEPLSSFAISIAAGVALEIYPAMKNFRKQGIDKQIKLAFNEALNDWSVNEDIRTEKEREFRSLLQSHIETKEISILKVVNPETLDFLDHFEKRLAEHTQAYDYLKSIIDQQRHDEVVLEFSTIKEQLSEIQEEIKKGNIDARDVGDWLDKIDFKEGQEKVIEIIRNWYFQKDIELELREVLLLATKKIYERTNELNQEIKELKSQGDTYLAGVLEQIKKAVEQRKPDVLTAIYEAYLQKEKEQKIELLQELIDSSKAIFAYEEVKQFYKELLKIEPSAQNHYLYGKFLHDFNFFEDSIKQYKKALEILRGLAKKNPRVFLPYVANLLNDLAVLYHYKKEFQKALVKYEEALEIRRALAKENPYTYLPDVATTLNNLAILHKTKNEFQQALDRHKEALEIRRGLVKENPNICLHDVAVTLNNLANLYSIKNEFSLGLDSYIEALEIRRNLAKENPHIYLPYVATTLNNLGNLYSAKNDLSLSLDSYTEALKIRRDLVEENPRIHLPVIAQTLHNLGNLYSAKDDLSLSLDSYKEALEIRRNLAKENPNSYLPDVAMTLNNLAVLHKARNEFQLALKSYEESLRLYKSLAEKHEKVYDVIYAQSFLMGVFLFKKDTSGIEEIKEILQRYAEVPQAKKLLKTIDNLEKKKAP